MASTARIEELRKKYEENQRRYFAPLANEYRKAGQLEEAIALCRAWLPQQPGHMSGHIVFGQTLFESGELAEARTVFETALELDPENLIALRHLGDIARQHGEVASARSWYQRVLDADPRNDEIAALLAELRTRPAVADAPVPTAADSGWGDIDPSAVAEEEPSPSGVEALAPEPADAGLALDMPTASAEEAAWGSAEELEREVRGGLASSPAGSSDADALFDESVGTVGIDTDAISLELHVAGGEADAAAEPASSGTDVDPAGDYATVAGVHNDTVDDAATAGGVADGLGLEVMEFVPPPRSPARTDRAEPSPFDGHLLADDADGSGATPAAFVTETMAELYLQQGFRDEALGVYRQLLEQSPDDEGLRERVAQLESGSRSSLGMAAISNEVIESAQRRQAAHTPPSMRAFLARLAGRRAPRRADHDGAPQPPAEDDHPADDFDAVLGEPTGTASEGRAGRTTPGAGAQLGALTEDSGVWRLPPDDSAATADPDAGTAEWSSDASGDEGGNEVPDETGGDVVFLDLSTPGTGDEPEPPQPPAPRTTPPGAGTVPEGSSPSAGAAPRPATPPTGSVGALFAGAVVQAADEVAASALAAAFAPAGERPASRLLGRPTRAANSEISLDHVFRESGSRPATPRERGSFSFDQFFADGSSGSGGAPAAPAGAGAAGEVPDDDAPHDDIAQFNTWLEGLKKK